MGRSDDEKRQPPPPVTQDGDRSRTFDTTAPRREAPLSAATGKSVPAEAASSDADVAAFVARLKTAPLVGAAGNGRLIFAMDATMSRQATWDMALALQADMFAAVREVGSLDVQLVYFRGQDECRASRWVGDAAALSRLMTTVGCAGGYTQIRKVLSQAARESAEKRVHALVYVGDAMEEEVDDLCGRAGELAILGVPVFLFQEGRNVAAARAFAEIARITRGAHCQFDAGSARQLKALLTAVATYATGGRRALERARDRGEAGAVLLLEHMGKR